MYRLLAFLLEDCADIKVSRNMSACLVSNGMTSHKKHFRQQQKQIHLIYSIHHSPSNTLLEGLMNVKMPGRTFYLCSRAPLCLLRTYDWYDISLLLINLTDWLTRIAMISNASPRESLCRLWAITARYNLRNNNSNNNSNNKRNNFSANCNATIKRKLWTTGLIQTSSIATASLATWFSNG